MKKAIFWLLVLIFLAYVGFQFGFPYYRYLAFKSDAKEILRVSVEVRNEEDLRNLIFDRAKELKVPIDKKDIEVIKTEKDMRVKVSWSEVVDILGVYQKTLKFDIDTAL